jgi:type II restriction enzyme
LQGFSIKSQIGAPSTLINASKATNFTYAITGNGTPKNMNDKDVKGNTQSLYKQNFSLDFLNIDSTVYMENMRLIDSQLPNYIAELLIEFNRQKGGLLTDIIDHAFTEDKEQKVLKIKEFLVASALGMMPNTKWDGQLTTMGGIILVKKTSDVLCFYLYNMEDFQNYLLKHVKFETPSTTRYGIGKIINEDSILKYKLNLQIRFIK